jgi:hypothetical protein
MCQISYLRSLSLRYRGEVRDLRSLDDTAKRTRERELTHISSSSATTSYKRWKTFPRNLFLHKERIPMTNKTLGGKCRPASCRHEKSHRQGFSVCVFLLFVCYIELRLVVSFSSAKLRSAGHELALVGIQSTKFKHFCAPSDSDCADSIETTIKISRQRASSDVLCRRSVLTGGIVSVAATLSISTNSAASAIVEVDKQSGQLFVPKSIMLGGGGSDETRGISLSLRDRSQETGETRSLSRTAGPIQTVYETRFIAYLSRFLLKYDPATKSWWESDVPASSSGRALKFAQFAESVEVGLADYFVGPYGSYASVNAARAGLSAQSPARSAFNDKKGSSDTIKAAIRSLTKGHDSSISKKRKPRLQAEAEQQGVLNLLALLQARYRSSEEKVQLAILFVRTGGTHTSTCQLLMSSPFYQPLSTAVASVVIFVVILVLSQ